MPLSVSEQHELATIHAEVLRRTHYKFRQYFPDEGPLRRELYLKHLALFKGGATYQERVFLKANRVGGTDAAAYEATCHLTGLYPNWWEGRRFEGPIDAWVSGDTSTTCRDIIQVALLGPIETVDSRQWSGMLPAHLVVDVSRKHGIPNAVETIWVQHCERQHGAPCLSQIQCKSYDQRREAFQGTAKHLVWLDEEPPGDIYTESLLRTMATSDFPGGLLLVTFTPLSGLSLFIKEYLELADFYSAAGEIVPAPERFWNEVAGKDAPPIVRSAAIAGNTEARPASEPDIGVVRPEPAPRLLPAWRYHATEPPKIIQGPAEEADGWVDSPAKLAPSGA